MANVLSANSAYVDSTGSITTNKGMKLIEVFFTAAASNDELLLTDGSGGSNKFYCAAATAHDTKQFRVTPEGIVFPNGVYVQTLTAGAKAILVLKPTQGG